MAPVMLSHIFRGLVAAGLTMVLTGAGVRPVAGIATEPAGPGNVRILANCLDFCTVTVELSGNGSGSWQSTNSSHVADNKINCVWLNGAQAPGSDCTEVYGGDLRVSPVRLNFRVVPSTGSEGCWAGLCYSAPFTDYYDLPSSNTPVSTTLLTSFKLLKYLVSVSLPGTGFGRVISSPPIFNCPGICSDYVAYGTALTFNAAAFSGSYFAGWGGACAGQSESCQLTITGPISTTATFTLGSPPTPSPPAATPVVTPAPTRTAPVATPKATVKPTGTPTPGKTPTATQATTAAPASSAAQATADPSGQDEPSEGPTATGSGNVRRTDGSNRIGASDDARRGRHGLHADRACDPWRGFAHRHRHRLRGLDAETEGIPSRW